MAAPLTQVTNVLKDSKINQNEGNLANGVITGKINQNIAKNDSSKPTNKGGVTTQQQFPMQQKPKQVQQPQSQNQQPQQQQTPQQPQQQPAQQQKQQPTLQQSQQALQQIQQLQQKTVQQNLQPQQIQQIQQSQQQVPQAQQQHLQQQAQQTQQQNQQQQMQQNSQYSIENYEESKTNLIINYLPPNMSEGQLSILFSPYGSMLNCKIVVDLNTNRSRGYGFVEYSTSESAKKALEALNGFGVGGKKLKVAYARPKCKEIQNANLYITNIPPNYDAKKLAKHFEPFGKIVECRILRDSNGKSRGVGFVRMDTHLHAIEALNKRDNYTVEPGMDPILVKLAQRRAPRRWNKPNGGGSGGGLNNHPMNMPQNYGNNFPNYGNNSTILNSSLNSKKIKNHHNGNTGPMQFAPSNINVSKSKHGFYRPKNYYPSKTSKSNPHMPPSSGSQARSKYPQQQTQFYPVHAPSHTVHHHQYDPYAVQHLPPQHHQQPPRHQQQYRQPQQHPQHIPHAPNYPSNNNNNAQPRNGAK